MDATVAIAPVAMATAVPDARAPGPARTVCWEPGHSCRRGVVTHDLAADPAREKGPVRSGALVPAVLRLHSAEAY